MAAWRALGRPTLPDTRPYKRHLGDPRCYFGHLNPSVEATVAVGGSHIVCNAPRHWRLGDFRTEAVDLNVSLNGGQDQLLSRTPAHTYSYYSLASRLGLSVSDLSPDGGPSAGGTLVRIKGTGVIAVVLLVELPRFLGPALQLRKSDTVAARLLGGKQRWASRALP